MPLLVGTDSPNVPGMYPGYSVHHELRSLVKAGLTPYEALSAATRAPGDFITRNVPGAERAGTVKHGLRADLVLVEKNPLTCLETLESPLGVMKADRWFPRAQLSALLEQGKTKYGIAQ